jgi:tetraprenyl-beta-curcumene synthase
MKIPTRPFGLMTKIYRHVLPEVHKQLSYWKGRAEEIPNPELRRQALESIRTKTFHCEGGGIYSLLANERLKEAVSFIVAYQTISDYLDNLCDRSTSLDPEDFRALHDSMHHALTPGQALTNYYRFREDTDDGGYLEELVQTCQRFLEGISQLDIIQPALWELEGYYSDLQVHKHVKQDERVPRLQEWFQSHQTRLPKMTWYEFSACSGSTLGIFCIVSYALANHKMETLVHQLKDGYFPWVQGLHILLDYFVDQDEDKEGGDLNFCFYYENEETMIQRIHHFIEQSDQSIARLPDTNFHRMINRGLLGIYLADRKVKEQKKVRQLARKIMRRAGGAGLFFFVNGWLYRRLKPGL